jgi:hypothetical protein
VSWADASRYEVARLYVAVMLAPTVELCEALLRGEAVPHPRLCSWVTRFAESEDLGTRVYLDQFHSIPTRTNPPVRRRALP